MPKAYWISAYQAIHDEAALQAYARLAGPALQSAGGRILARGLPAAVKEQGKSQRTVIVEFDNLQAALDAYQSPGYQEALAALGPTAAHRDIRIIEGL